MADIEAKFQDGKSVTPQARPASDVEWNYSDGKSGDIGADEYVAAGGLIPYPFSRGARGGQLALSGGLQ